MDENNVARQNLAYFFSYLAGFYTPREIPDENGNPILFERSPIGGIELKKFDWESVDIERELLWIEIATLLDGGMEDWMNDD